MFYSLWLIFIPGISVICVEHPKGEYLVVLCLLFGYCFRLRLRCSDFLHLLVCDFSLRGFLLHDVVCCLGLIDIVFGSVDR